MSNPQSDAMSGQVLMKAMGQMFPQLAHIQAAYCWGGLVDITADRLPKEPVNTQACTTPWATVATAYKPKFIWVKLWPM
ncbi:hypothetical protein P4S72_27600 [Vibrio sp. PP-XX7]